MKSTTHRRVPNGSLRKSSILKEPTSSKIQETDLKKLKNYCNKKSKDKKVKMNQNMKRYVSLNIKGIQKLCKALNNKNFGNW